MEELGYVAEHYGKWHMPDQFNYVRGARIKRQRWYEAEKGADGKLDLAKRVIRYNDYSFGNDRPLVDESKRLKWPVRYRRELETMIRKTKFSRAKPKPGQQLDPYSKIPYYTLPIDGRYEQPPGYQLQTSSTVVGWWIAPSKYSGTALNVGTATIRLKELAKDYLRNGQPFSLTLSINAPHAPFVGSPEFHKKYKGKSKRIWIPKNLDDDMKNSAYHRLKTLRTDHTAQDVQEWTCVYYAMVEEVDYYLGRLFQELKDSGIENDTLVVFTSDHGEMLGAHGRTGKATLLEESVRVPLILKFPPRIKAGTVVQKAVSNLDLFATVLDYMGASEFDHSDGHSLRRFIEETSTNEYYDESVVVAEHDDRNPILSSSASYNARKTLKDTEIIVYGSDNQKVRFSGQLAADPNFMVRHGDYKLILPKDRNSELLDMMFNLKRDPYELNNLLGKNGMSADEQTIGMAEKLKILLLEWMTQHDGGSGKHFYSKSLYNGGEGKGDIAEIKSRRTWRRLDYWQSDTFLEWGKPVETTDELGNKRYKRCEYIYAGRTTPGKLYLKKVLVQGKDKSHFKIDPAVKKRKINTNQYVRVRVCYDSKDYNNVGELKAYVSIFNSVTGRGIVQFV